MKRLIFSACLVAAGLGMVSCEKHDWDDTKKLYQSHDDHSGEKAGEHGADDHAGHKHEGGH